MESLFRNRYPVHSAINISYKRALMDINKQQKTEIISDKGNFKTTNKKIKNKFDSVN